MEPFTNADVPPSPGLATFGIEVDEVTVSDVLQYPDYIDRFLRHAFDFNLQTNMLGKCASYHEAYCYRVNTINDSHAVSLALLLGNLVDSAKGGFKFDETRWFQYKNANKLSQILPEPAYKDRTRTAPAKLDHTTDYLVFKTVTNVIDDTLAKFSKHIVNISSRDDDLFRIRNEEQEEAKRNIALASVLKNLGADLESINSYWGKHTGPYYDKENYQPGREVNPLSFRTVVERCRTDFLSIKPVVDEDSVAVNSDRIASWQRNHSHGLSSHWDLLKASVAYYRYHWKPFVWNTAGVELGEIKATARGRGTYRPVRTDVFVAMKLDNKVVDSAKRREMLDKVGDSKGEVYDDGDDDDDAQYGDWDWDIDEC